jgi:hypothetical protein
MDANDAWPTPGHLHLDGFNFNHLGGFKGETGTEIRAGNGLVGQDPMGRWIATGALAE